MLYIQNMSTNSNFSRTSFAIWPFNCLWLFLSSKEFHLIFHPLNCAKSGIVYWTHMWPTQIKCQRKKSGKNPSCWNNSHSLSLSLSLLTSNFPSLFDNYCCISVICLLVNVFDLVIPVQCFSTSVPQYTSVPWNFFRCAAKS